MSRLTRERILPLRRVVAAREMACRSELEAVLREENAIRRAIAELSSGIAVIAPGADLRAADLWHRWRMEQRKGLQRDLATVLARKDVAQKALGLASAKSQAVERLCDLVTAEQRRKDERRSEQSALTADLLARHARGRQSS